MLCDALIGQTYVCMMMWCVWVGICGGTCAQQLTANWKLSHSDCRFWWFPSVLLSPRHCSSVLGEQRRRWSIAEQFENYQELISNECIEFWEMHRHTVPVICARVLLILTLSTVVGVVVGTGQCSVSSIPGMGRTKRVAVAAAARESNQLASTSSSIVLGIGKWFRSSSGCKSKSLS